ncbi:MAG: hypothetical protein ACYDCS_00835 [Candidatus Dormibacteria bacterium]
MTAIRRGALLLLLLLLGSALAACGSTPAPSPTATPVPTPVPTSGPTAPPAPTATPSPTPTAAPAPAPVLTTRCDVVGTAQGGSVSWQGTAATWELLISPGGIVVNPTNTSGEYGPLTAGTYTYVFKDAAGNETTQGRFTVAACPA